MSYIYRVSIPGLCPNTNYNRCSDLDNLNRSNTKSKELPGRNRMERIGNGIEWKGIARREEKRREEKRREEKRREEKRRERRCRNRLA